MAGRARFVSDVLTAVKRARLVGGCRRRLAVLALGAVVLAAAGCSGRTTGATNIVEQPNGTYDAQLNAIGSCDNGSPSTPCTAFMRYRPVGTTTWTNLPSFNVPSKVSNVPFSQTATGLFPEVSYEYQVCGKEFSQSSSLCVGPDGSISNPTTSEFVATERSTDWRQFHYTPDRVGYNPWEITINQVNVGNLTIAWTGTTGGPIDSSRRSPTGWFT